MVKEKMNRKTQVQWRASEETPPTSLGATITGNVPVNRAAIEREARELLGPEVFASDLFWDALGAVGGLHWFLIQPVKSSHGVRDRVQALARKYRSRPAIFVYKFQQIMKQRAKSLRASPEGKEGLNIMAGYWSRVGQHNEAIARTQPGIKPSAAEKPIALTQGLSKRKLAAVRDSLPSFQSLLKGRPIELDLKQLFEILKAFAAGDTGRPPEPMYDEALKILDSKKYPKRPIHNICRELVSGYSGFTLSKQEAERKRMKAGIKRHRQKGTKSPR
jgi:hypothetical protein